MAPHVKSNIDQNHCNQAIKIIHLFENMFTVDTSVVPIRVATVTDLICHKKFSIYEPACLMEQCRKGVNITKKDYYLFFLSSIIC